MNLRIAGTLPFSISNGKGFRYVIFTQGCIHLCEGCQNPDTWDADGGRDISVDELVSDITKRKHIQGITISGGEPFLQQEACVELIEKLPDHLDVWIYTGYLYEEIQYTLLASFADFIVDGRFHHDKKVEGRMFGSSNQRIIDVKKGVAV